MKVCGIICITCSIFCIIAAISLTSVEIISIILVCIIIAIIFERMDSQIKEKIDSLSSSLENSTVIKTETKITEVFESDKWVGKERKTTIVENGKKQKTLLFDEGLSQGVEKYINENLPKVLKNKISDCSDEIKTMLENKIDEFIKEQKKDGE